jgi:hypothetical protein
MFDLTGARRGAGYIAAPPAAQNRLESRKVWGRRKTREGEEDLGSFCSLRRALVGWGSGEAEKGGGSLGGEAGSVGSGRRGDVATGAGDVARRGGSQEGRERGPLVDLAFGLGPRASLPLSLSLPPCRPLPAFRVGPCGLVDFDDCSRLVGLPRISFEVDAVYTSYTVVYR